MSEEKLDLSGIAESMTEAVRDVAKGVSTAITNLNVWGDPPPPKPNRAERRARERSKRKKGR